MSLLFADYHAKMEEIAIDSTDSESGKQGSGPEVEETNRAYVRKKCLSDREWFAQVRSTY